MSAAFCFSNKVQMLEYYHNSSWWSTAAARSMQCARPLCTRSTNT